MVATCALERFLILCSVNLRQRVGLASSLCYHRASAPMPQLQGARFQLKNLNLSHGARPPQIRVEAHADRVGAHSLKREQV